MSHFLHEPLKSPSEQIRLIRLLPRQPRYCDIGPFQEDGIAAPLVSPATPDTQAIKSVLIHCTIHHVLLHDKQNPPVFTAMSYTWGESTRNHCIKINDAPFLVTESLEVMLRHIQSTTDTLTLWIDQLCIDQTNTDEKSAQVPLMKEIYTAAIQTIIWLGPTEKESDAIMEFLADVGKEAHDFGLLEIKLAEFQNWSEESEKNDRLRPINNGLNALLKRVGATIPLRPFASLIARPWFYRVWVVQEVALGREVEFKCGEKIISYDHLHAACFFHVFYNWKMMESLQLFNPIDLMRNISILMDLNAINLAPITHMLSARKKYQAHAAGKGDSLYNLLLRNYVGTTNAARLVATDPRDMIFGLLGLANDVEQLGIATDYNKTCVEVYTDVARRLIENGNVDVLAFSQDPKSLPPNQGGYLPSWVPDWSGWIQQQRVEIAEKAAPFTACGTTRVSIHKSNTLSNSTGILKLEGVRVDKIEKIGTVLTLPSNIGRKLNLERYVFLKEIENFCKESAGKLDGIYTDPRVKEEAVWRVPIGDRGWDKEISSGGFPFTGRATTTCLQGYEALRKFFTRIEHLGEVGGEKVLHLNDDEGVASQYMDNSSFPTSAPTDGSNATEPVDTIGTMSEDAISYMAMIDDQKSRRPFLSGKGYVGLGPSHMEPGDVICILFGASVPYIFRHRDIGFVLVGEAYCYGIMDGELMEQDPAPESFMIF